MPPLEVEEQALLESVELGEWQSVPDVTQELERYQNYAQSQVDGWEPVSLELPTSDLQRLRAVAQESGVSVSRLMAAVLHQFVVTSSGVKRGD
jgi:predicted DNA binding CopG/RHH family protein